MSSHNFDALINRWPSLYDFALVAELQAHPDPHSSVLKLRCFAEQLVGILSRELNLPTVNSGKFYDKLENSFFIEIAGMNLR
jgi:hypothetical protein